MCTWGSCPTPCQVQGSVGAVYPMLSLFPGGIAPTQGQSDTRRKDNTGGGQLSRLESAPTVTTAVSQSTLAWMLLVVEGCADLHAWWHLVAGESCSPVTSLPPVVLEGTLDPWLCPLGALGSGVCAAGIPLPGPQIPKAEGRSPLCPEPPTELLLRPQQLHAPGLY